MDTFDVSCKICDDPQILAIFNDLHAAGWGRDRIWVAVREYGVGKHTVAKHKGHTFTNVMSSIERAIDSAEVEVSEDYWDAHGIAKPPPGTKWVAATVVDKGPSGASWMRIRPIEEETEETRVEIRQAQPVTVEGKRPSLTLLTKGDWRLWAIVPDGQEGYWVDNEGTLRPTHDERAFDLGHQIISWMANREPLYGIGDCGDFLDLSAPSRWDPAVGDSSVRVINATLQRASEELAWRRWVVGDEGRVVVLSGNHDDRLRQFLTKSAGWLVGLRRPGDEEDEWPVLSVPYLVRAKDYGVTWVENFPGSYFKLNDNLVVMHSPALSSRPLDTAKRIANTIHASVIHGHSHRAERASFNLETTDKGVRTFTVWSSGCWARIDGALPSGKNSYNSYGDRIVANSLGSEVGYLSENMHQGFDFVWVEQGGSQRWSAEHIEFWGSWAQFRGHEFYASVDIEGNAL